MSRRGQQARNAVRRAKRDAAEALESQEGSYRPPKDLGLPKQWATAYDDANTVRVQFNIWRDKGRILNFVINVQVITPDGWISVERYDCCHGNCHLHHDNDDHSRDVVRRLDDLDDVQRAFAEASREAEHRARIIRDKGE